MADIRMYVVHYAEIDSPACIVGLFTNFQQAEERKKRVEAEIAAIPSGAKVAITPVMTTIDILIGED